MIKLLYEPFDGCFGNSIVISYEPPNNLGWASERSRTHHQNLFLLLMSFYRLRLVSAGGISLPNLTRSDMPCNDAITRSCAFSTRLGWFAFAVTAAGNAALMAEWQKMITHLMTGTGTAAQTAYRGALPGHRNVPANGHALSTMRNVARWVGGTGSTSRDMASYNEAELFICLAHRSGGLSCPCRPACHV